MISSLHRLWTAPAPLRSTSLADATSGTVGSVGTVGPVGAVATVSTAGGSSPEGAAARVRALAWPVAIGLILHRVFIVALNGTPTDDFSTVYQATRRFWSSAGVYDQAYNFVDPLYLYTPGATLALSPLGLVDNFAAVRTAFIVVNAVGIVAALALLCRAVGHSLRGWLWPVSIALAFATESVTNTLAFTNINGLLLLALSVFLLCCLRSWEGHTAGGTPPDAVPAEAEPTVIPWLSWVAGLALGCAILIKPQFAPLLFLAIVKLDWRVVLGGLLPPVVLNAIAWPIVPGADGYLRNLVPYLATTRDYANSSLQGFAVYFDAEATVRPVWILTAVLVAVTVIVLLRWRHSDVTVWLLTSVGVIFAGIFLLSSLGQQYYSMWLFPTLFTAVLPHSVMRSAGAWAAAFCFLTPTTWDSHLAPMAGRWLGTFLGTVGWLLFIVAACVTVLAWWSAERRGLKRASNLSSPAPRV